ncbi:MAG: hypothetical protein AAGA56_28175, partial [Myxococcota bacterium]
LVASTGRPAGWVQGIAHQWPLRAAMAENGAIAFMRQGHGLRTLDPVEPAVRAARRERLEALAKDIAARCGLTRTDDAFGRISDITFDIGESHRASAEVLARARTLAREGGARSSASSIHFHITLDTFDKASGAAWLLREVEGEEATRLRHRWAFIGDSGNDAPCFAAFRTTFGVANAHRYRSAFSRTPRYVASREEGAGFVQIVKRLLEVKR